MDKDVSNRGQNWLAFWSKNYLTVTNNDHSEENQFRLSEITHTFPEWKDPGISRIPLSIEDIINATLNDEKEKEEALSDLELSAQLQRMTFRNRVCSG